MPAGQDTGEQIGMVLQVELDRFLVPGRHPHPNSRTQDAGIALLATRERGEAGGHRG